MATQAVFEANRATEPDWTSLTTALLALDSTAIIGRTGTTYRIIKATDWTGPQIQAAQNVIDTAPASSPQLTAQSVIDNMPIFEKAILLTMLDQINTLRTQPTTVFAAVTPAQAIAAVRTKAGTL